MFSHPPLPTAALLIYFFHVLLASLEQVKAVFYGGKLMVKLSQTLRLLSLQKTGRTIPTPRHYLFQQALFGLYFFAAFWCTYCIGTLKKQATEHKVK